MATYDITLSSPKLVAVLPSETTTVLLPAGRYQFSAVPNPYYQGAEEWWVTEYEGRKVGMSRSAWKNWCANHACGVSIIFAK